MKIMLDKGAKVSRAHKTDAGLDLCSMEDGWIFPKCHFCIAKAMLLLWKSLVTVLSTMNLVEGVHSVAVIVCLLSIKRCV